jgi:hypothetical protein
VKVVRRVAKPTRITEALLFAGVCGASCNRAPTASQAQCELLRDRFVGLELSSDPTARALTPGARADLRGRLAVEALEGPHAAKLDSRCEAQVTETAYKCAVAASTLAAWEQCFE